MLCINFTIDHYIILIGFLFFTLLLSIIVQAKNCSTFLGWILICGITLYTKSEWGYLLLIIYIALKFNIIDNNFLGNLNILKKAWAGKYKTENVDNKDIKTLKDQTISEIKQAAIQKINITPQKIMDEYTLSESLVINWFASNLDIPFETNKKVTGNNRTKIYPDGIFENETEISILEVRRGFGGANIEMFKRGLNTLLRTKNFYNSSDKLINLYLAFVLKNNNEIEKLKQYIQKENYKFSDIYIFFFEESGKSIEFIEKFDI